VAGHAATPLKALRSTSRWTSQGDPNYAGYKRTVAAIVRVLSVRSKLILRHPPARAVLTSSAATSSIKRSHIPGTPTLCGGAFLLLTEPLTHNHHHSRDLKCNACGPALLAFPPHLSPIEM
jgi:hypothetical protein